MKLRSFGILSSHLFLIVSFGCFSTISASCKKVQAEGHSAAECVMEVNSRRILYQEHGDIRLPMASTTKIVTAISVLESGIDINQNIQIPANAVGIEGSSVYLKEGETYSVKDLLYGLMLRSGNDCAVALALHIDGEISSFSSRMNRTAQVAGALNSRFSNPHGLPAKNHYTTAVDLSLITAYAMQSKDFREIVSTKCYSSRNWTNKNKMLYRYDGAIGVKTGFTKEAGRCLVTAAEKDGMTLVATVLNSPNMYERTSTLLDDAFRAYSLKKILSAEQILCNDEVKGQVGEDYFYPMLEGEEEYLETVISPRKDPQNKKIVGQFEIYLLKRLLFSGNLYKL